MIESEKILINLLLKNQSYFYDICDSKAEKEIQELDITPKKEYKGYAGIVEFFSDFLQDDFYIDDNRYKEKRIKFEIGDRLVFYDVIISEWIPRMFGLLYHKKFWKPIYKSLEKIIKEHNRMFKNFKFADIKLGTFTVDNIKYKRISINGIKNEIAHSDISRGIVVFIKEKDLNGNILDILDNKGAVFCKKIRLKVCTNRKFRNSDIWTYHKMGINFPKIYFIVEEIEFNDRIFEDSPILGNAWNCYIKKSELLFIYHYFWIGTKNYKESFRRACDWIIDSTKNKYLLEINEIDGLFHPRRNTKIFGPIINLDELKRLPEFNQLFKTRKLKKLKTAFFSIITIVLLVLINIFLYNSSQNAYLYITFSAISTIISSLSFNFISKISPNFFYKTIKIEF
ncbi:MAG: hypothetical protein ACTSVV_05435 [Promethearchaeota archaeon]